MHHVELLLMWQFFTHETTPIAQKKRSIQSIEQHERGLRFLRKPRMTAREQSVQLEDTLFIILIPSFAFVPIDERSADVLHRAR